MVLDRTAGSFFSTFSLPSDASDADSTTDDTTPAATGNMNCPAGTRAVGFSFLPNDYGIEQLKVRASHHACIPA